MTGDSRSSTVAVPVSVRDHALFLDFDGTLAPLQDDPDTVALPVFGEQVLLQLHACLDGALALISGRDVRDLSTRTPRALRRAGGHGLEICEPGDAPADVPTAIAPALLAQTQRVVAVYNGVRIEQKGPVLAIHFRQNPSVEAALLEQLQQVADGFENYKAQHGKMVIELKPTHANKGIALRHMMQSAAFSGRIPIMVGDDTTDEDAMRVAAELGGYGIKVGDGTTLAKHRFDNTELVWDWLRSIVNEHA